MRKVLPAVVLGVGAFLLTLGLLLKFVAYPQLAVVPLDQNSQSVVADDNATFFDADNVRPGSGAITTISTQIGKPEESKKASEELGQDIAIWEIGQKSDNNNDNWPMSAGTERVAFDRHTGEAVNCCDENIDGVEVKHEGQIVKFPFDTQPVDTYRWWDGTTKQAYPVKYEGEEDLKGLTVYKFTSEVPLTRYSEMELPDFVFGLKDAGPVKADRYYSNKRTFWVEPATGVVIDRLEEQHQEFQAPGVEPLTALDTDSRFTPETVQANIDEYGSKASALSAIKGPGSIGLMVLGGLIMLAGLLLSLMTGRRRRAEAVPASTAADTSGDVDDTTVRRSDLHG